MPQNPLGFAALAIFFGLCWLVIAALYFTRFDVPMAPVPALLGFLVLGIISAKIIEFRSRGSTRLRDRLLKGIGPMPLLAILALVTGGAVVSGQGAPMGALMFLSGLAVLCWGWAYGNMLRRKRGQA